MTEPATVYTFDADDATGGDWTAGLAPEPAQDESEPVTAAGWDATVPGDSARFVWHPGDVTVIPGDRKRQARTTDTQATAQRVHEAHRRITGTGDG